MFLSRYTGQLDYGYNLNFEIIFRELRMILIKTSTFSIIVPLRTNYQPASSFSLPGKNMAGKEIKENYSDMLSFL